MPPLVVLLTRDGDEPPAAGELDRCRGLLAEAMRDCSSREFGRLVAGTDDPRPTVAAIELAVTPEGLRPLQLPRGDAHRRPEVRP